jgi:hypothetical protein
MPTIWTDYVKSWAQKNNTTYGCALGKPELKEDYKKYKEGKKIQKDLVVQPVEMGSPSIEATNKNIKINRPIKKMVKKAKPKVELVIEEEPTPMEVRKNIKSSIKEMAKNKNPNLMALAKALKPSEFSKSSKILYGGEDSFITNKSDKFGNRWLFGSLGDWYGIQDKTGKINYFKDDNYKNKTQENYYNDILVSSIGLDKEELVKTLLK